MAEKHFACLVSDVPVGKAMIVRIRNRTLGVFRLPDGFAAVLNVCPHRGAALCEGPVCGTTDASAVGEFIYGREGEIIRCAWHGWEFDIRSGRSLVDPKVRARTFPVSVEDDRIFIHV
jgi:nitrite reductase (NADH) small subunit